MSDSVCGFPLKLPIGVQTPAGLQKDFQVMQVSGVTEKILTNDNLRTNHNQGWLARLLASVLDNVGGEPVYSVFRKTEFREIPEIVKSITLQDAAYILALAHMNSYGPTLKEVLQLCPSCNRKDRYVVDLSGMRVVGLDRPTEPIVADLGAGFFRETPTSGLGKATAEQRTRAYHGKHWNRYLLRPATMKDAILYEKFCTPSNKLNFHMKLVAASLLGVEAWDGDGENRVKIAEMPQDEMQMLTSDMSLFEELNASDRMLLRRAVNDIPRLEMSVSQTCNNCGDDVSLAVDIGSFFPLS